MYIASEIKNLICPKCGRIHTFRYNSYRLSKSYTSTTVQGVYGYTCMNCDARIWEEKFEDIMAKSNNPSDLVYEMYYDVRDVYNIEDCMVLVSIKEKFLWFTVVNKYRVSVENYLKYKKKNLFF